MEYLESSTVKLGIKEANNLASFQLNAPSSARGIKAPNKAKKPQSKDWGFLLYGNQRSIAPPDVARGAFPCEVVQRRQLPGNANSFALL